MDYNATTERPQDRRARGRLPVASVGRVRRVDSSSSREDLGRCRAMQSRRRRCRSLVGAAAVDGRPGGMHADGDRDDSAGQSGRAVGLGGAADGGARHWHPDGNGCTMLVGFRCRMVLSRCESGRYPCNADTRLVTILGANRTSSNYLHHPSSEARCRCRIGAHSRWPRARP
jgi:hypothetical protein